MSSRRDSGFAVVRTGSRPAGSSRMTGYVQIAIERQRERSGNRCGGHDQDVRVEALLAERRPLQDAEAMLLIDDNQAEVA